jgi:F0F1-type ATP synthase assembly protein I
MATHQHDDQSANGLRDERTGELVKQLTEDVRTLVRKEIELGKAELSAKGRQAGAGAGMLSGGAVMGLLALAALTTCLIAALDTAMPLWLAALIVGVVYGAIAGVLAVTGKNQVQEAAPPVPEETVDSVKEDMQWLKTQK